MKLTHLVCLAGLLPATVLAGSAVSHLKGIGDPTNPGSMQVALCYNPVNNPYSHKSGNIEPGQTISIPSGYFTNFNIRLYNANQTDPCDTSSGTYVGNVTLTGTASGLTMATPSFSSVAKIANMSLANGQLTGQTEYVPPANVKLPTPDNKSVWQYVGINLSGNEFGTTWNPANSPAAAEMEPFIADGMNTVRLPIRWAYLQPSGAGEGSLEPNYLAFIDRFLEDTTQAGVNVIVDLHNYMRYSPAGVGVAGVPAGGSQPEGKLTSESALVNVWTQLVTALQADKNIDMSHVIFDLSNEPDNMESIGGTETALAYENAVIAAIRKLGLKNLILVEGNNWTGLHSWFDKTAYGATANSDVFTAKGIVDIGHNFAINVHQYFDSNFSGTQNDCIPNSEMSKLNIDKFVSFLKENHLRAFVTEFNTGRGTNCMADLQTFMQDLKANAYTKTKGYGFIGWTAWSAGHAWGGYPAYTLYLDNSAPQMAVLQTYLK